MFGYVKPFQPELQVKELDTYKALYCSLCKSMGKYSGVFSRFFLNYDFVFLVLLCLSLSDDAPEFCQKRCFVHPMKKRSCCTCSHSQKELIFCSDAVSIATYYKILDNIADNPKISGTFFRILLLFLIGPRKKAIRRNPELEDIFKTAFENQIEVETSADADSDKAAHPFANALLALFSLVSDDKDTRTVLERLGYLLGRFIYLADAFDDFEKDKRKNNFNPFSSMSKDDALVFANESLRSTVYELNVTFDLLSVRRYGDIIKNILSFGLLNTIKIINSKKERSE